MKKAGRLCHGSFPAAAAAEDHHGEAEVRVGSPAAVDLLAAAVQAAAGNLNS